MVDDERIRMALARLTTNERECLRRRLLPQTAKEMAAELGISPHAVEKRLKMARAKLGVSSSLEAARLLAASEGYQPLVPRPSDLSPGNGKGEAMTVAAPASGTAAYRLPYQGLLMLMLLALLGFAAQDVPGGAPWSSPMRYEDGRTATARSVGLDEARTYLHESFAIMDSDHSGFFERAELGKMEPRDHHRDASLPPAPPRGARDTAAEGKWLDKLDHDHDGRVGVDEYVEYMMPWTLLSGVPASWRPRR